MKRKFVHFLLLAALVAVSSFALADPPARVGRVSLTEGQVTMAVNGEDETGNLVNWPVTNGNHLTTAPGARAEFRVGSAAVRLDGDSDVEVLALDDDRMSLRLNYGTASVRLRDPQMLGGFDLQTPQARIVMTEPGVVRVDTERAPDTTVVSILEGAAQVDGGGAMMTGRSGKRIEVRGDDLFSSVVVRDRFDDWVQTRDRREEGLPATRYLPNDVTGYEELDQYGTWVDNSEYGTLWAPRSVPIGWSPYSDGRWAWYDPWGWTWIDNAPWGYAPFHYGRWVQVNSRWCWAPGRFVGRPVWAPALVGWVGGGWGGGGHKGPGVGWYPLSPRDHFVPSYRVSPAFEGRYAWRHRSNDRWQEQHRDRDHDGRRDGVTMLPRDQFERRHTVQVHNVPRSQPMDVRNFTHTTPPAPANRPNNGRVDRNGDGRPDRGGFVDRNGDGRPDRNGVADRNGDGRPDRFERDNRVDNRPDNRVDNRADNRADNRNDWRDRNRNEQSRTITTTPQAPAIVRSPQPPQPQQGILSTTPPAVRPNAAPSQPQVADDRANRSREWRNRDGNENNRSDNGRNWRENREERNNRPSGQITATPPVHQAPPMRQPEHVRQPEPVRQAEPMRQPQMQAQVPQMAPARPAVAAPPPQAQQAPQPARSENHGERGGERGGREARGSRDNQR